MRQLIATTVLASALLSPAIAAAQIKTIPGEAHTVTATVEAMEKSTRMLTLKTPDGKLTTVTVPSDVKRYDGLKVGDQITAKYYDNVVLRKKAPGEKDVDTLTGAVTPSPGAKPTGTASAQRTITATITAIDPNVPSISLSGPTKWSYSTKVADKEALKQVKVGDKLDITWTEAVLLSVETPVKK
jgi:uncharacterized protein YcnI